MVWQIKSKKTLIKNSIFKVTEEECLKHDGSKAGTYYIVEKPDAVVVAAFLKEDKGKPNPRILLIHQYRHAVRDSAYELPAGYMEPKEHNSTLAAHRELLEETGYKATKFKKIGESYASAGFTTNRVHFFIALDAEKIQEQTLDPNEEIVVKITPWKQALKLLSKGEIKDMGSVTCLLLAKDHIK